MKKTSFWEGYFKELKYPNMTQYVVIDINLPNSSICGNEGRDEMHISKNRKNDPSTYLIIEII